MKYGCWGDVYFNVAFWDDVVSLLLCCEIMKCIPGNREWHRMLPRGRNCDIDISLGGLT